MINNLFWYFWASHENDPAYMLHDLKNRDKLPTELKDLVGCQQNSVYHPEGDAFNHTAHVCNAMKKICDREGLAGTRRRRLMFSALTHDIGKAKTTMLKDGKVVSYGHEIYSAALGYNFLQKVHCSTDESVLVCRLNRWHMSHCQNSWSGKAINKLYHNLLPAKLEDLVLLMEANCNGRPPIAGGLPESVHDLINKSKELGIYHG